MSAFAYFAGGDKRRRDKIAMCEHRLVETEWHTAVVSGWLLSGPSLEIADIRSIILERSNG
jgi:hypothetical protein